jgi:hypothetical protein
MKLKAVKIEHREQTEYRPQSLLDPDFRYVPAAATDVTQTWRRFGWKPIERKEKFYAQAPETPQSHKP